MSTLYQPGDVISRRKGVAMHRGIVLEDGNVLHNTPFQGCHTSTLTEFSKNKTVYPANHRAEIRDRTLSNVPHDLSQRYDLFNNNCEHTVTRATKNAAASPQLRGWVVGVAFAAVGLLVTRHPAVAIAGFVLGKKLGSRGKLA